MPPEGTIEDKIHTVEPLTEIGDQITIPVIPPIQVEIISDPSDQLNKAKKEEVKEMISDHLTEMGIKINPGRFTKFWISFNKHSFAYSIILGIGIAIGIFIASYVNHNELIKGVNLQIIEIKHNGRTDRFKILPSEIPPFYSDEERKPQPIIPKTIPEETHDLTKKVK